MKRLVILFALMVLFPFSISAQINIIPTEYITVNSYEGIVVKSIEVNQDKSLSVTFFNSNSNNYDRTGEVRTYCFDWYLSYKGKRISDYYKDAVRCGKTETHKVLFWPGEVPSGNEKYITCQFGKEKPKKDRRDDD